MAKTTKIPPCIIKNLADLQSVVAELVTLQLKEAALKTSLEQDIAALKDKRKTEILPVGMQIALKKAGIGVYCRANKRELFPDKKSLDLLLAVLAFRTNNPSVEITKGDTWEDAALRLASTDWGSEYLTDPAPEVCKSKILADRDKIGADKLAEVGLYIEQGEKFYITPKSEIAEQTVQQAV